MGKVWPRDSVALNTSTTALSNVVSLDESPLLEGLLYAGTDDGLLQITEDGGKNWRKVEDFPGVPKYTYVSDVAPSPRDANTVFVALNNWQRGDYKPYIVKSTDRGKSWTNITGNLPGPPRRVDRAAGPRERQPAVRRHRVRPVRQRRRRRPLGADEGRPAVDPGPRHGDPEARERPGARRPSAAASTSSTTTARCARSRRRRWPRKRGSSRCATPTRSRRVGMAPAGSAGIGTLSGNTTFDNPPSGAVFTYNVGAALAGGHEAGADDHQRAGPAGPPDGRRQGAGPAPRGLEPARRSAGRRQPGPRRSRCRWAGAGGGWRTAGAAGPRRSTVGAAAALQAAPAVLRPRRPVGPMATPGIYRAQLGKQVGDRVEPDRTQQTVRVARYPVSQISDIAACGLRIDGSADCGLRAWAPSSF